MTDLDELLDRLEDRLARIEAEVGDPERSWVFELLDGIDSLHRLALRRLAASVGPEAITRAGGSEPAVAWLLSAYGIGVDERRAAEAALDTVRPYIDSHGGSVELVGVSDGRVRLRLAGSCSGCTASAVTLSEGIEQALREGLPGFVAVEVEEDAAEPHAPPGETLVALGRKPA